jgi:hypothetical protein
MLKRWGKRHVVQMRKQSTLWIWLMMAVVLALDVAEVIIYRILINP